MFYFTPSKIASFFRSSCPSLTEYVCVARYPSLRMALILQPQIGTAERRLQRLPLTCGRRVDQDRRAHVVCA